MNGLVYLATSTGQAGAVSALQEGLTADTIWAAITPFIPVIITVTLVSLGIYLIRRIVKKAGKGKGGM